MNRLQQVERQRRNWRTFFIVVIIGTLPFYCAGLILWATAPTRGSSGGGGSNQTATLLPTNTPIGQPTETPFGFFASNTPIGVPTQLLPPTQIVPPIGILPPVVTLFFSPTSPIIFPPVPTLAPTLTFPPEQPVQPPTNTFFPTITLTFTPSPTLTPTETPPFVEATPIPFDNTPIPPGS